MLVTLKKKDLTRPMNLTGVSKFMMYGNNGNDNKTLHTHNDSNNYIDHKISDTRKLVKDIFVIYADPTR